MRSIAFACNHLPAQDLAGVEWHDTIDQLRHDAVGALQRDRPFVKRQPVKSRAMFGREGLKLVEMKSPEQCCGFGGTFSVKFGDISSHIADRKCADIVATGADAVVLGDLGCMLNIEGRLRRRGETRTRVLHIAEILAGAQDV